MPGDETDRSSAALETPAPNIRRLIAPNPSPMTAGGTNTYLVGERAVAVIDPGPEHSGHLAAILEATAGGTQIEAIFVTHSHLDHTAGVPALAEATGAPILGFGPSGAGRSKIMTRLAKQSDAFGGGEGRDTDYRPSIALADGETARSAFGAWALSAIHTPGHTSDHLCFAIPGSGVLFSGDHVMGWATSLVSPPDGDMGAFMRSLDLLADRDDALYLPGHGAPIAEPQARVAELKAHRLGREAQILAALSDGHAQPRDLVARLYSDVPPELHGMAERNVLAHLIDLWERKRVAPVGGFSATAAFART